MIKRIFGSRSARTSPRTRASARHEHFSVEALEARQLFNADLAVRFDTANFQVPAQVVPGDSFNAGILVKNFGPLAANGLVTIEFYASTNSTFDTSDVLMARYANEPIFLSANGINSEGDFADLVRVPAGLEPGQYFILVRILPNSQVNDTNQSNNIAITDTAMNVTWRFGDFAGRNDVRLTLTDGDKRVDFIWAGAGFGTVTKNQDGSFDIVTSGTTADTDISVDVRNGNRLTTIRNVTVNGSLDELWLARATFTGTIHVNGTVRRIDTANVVGSLSSAAGSGALIRIDGQTIETTFSFGQVSNLSIQTASGITALSTSGKWSDNDANPDLISAPFLRSLNIAGNFAAGIRLTASSATGGAPTLGDVQINGQAGTNAWVIAGGAAEIAVASTALTFSASFAGTVNTFRTTSLDLRGTLAAAKFNSIQVARTISKATILAGANLGADGRLGGADANADAFTFGQILGLHVASKVVNSLIAAGLDPVDGVLNNGNDKIKGGNGSKFGPIVIGGPTSANARFFAGKFVNGVMINNRSIIPQNDRRFVLNESAAPTANLVSLVPGFAPTQLQIRYRDNLILNYATFGIDDVKIVGPGGIEIAMSSFVAPNPINGKLKTITYAFAAPGGGNWTPAHNGTYQVVMNTNAVLDMNGNAVAPGILGEFTITL
ncbi:MAG: hypothetical protein KF768_03580 [Phycisphaeraceae bacterium]|nr:hypothetical protein [Phycisphaeraceae bacterium]